MSGRLPLTQEKEEVAPSAHLGRATLHLLDCDERPSYLDL
jgi:hypothetical protein